MSPPPAFATLRFLPERSVVRFRCPSVSVRRGMPFLRSDGVPLSERSAVRVGTVRNGFASAAGPFPNVIPAPDDSRPVERPRRPVPCRRNGKTERSAPNTNAPCRISFRQGAFSKSVRLLSARPGIALPPTFRLPGEERCVLFESRGSERRGDYCLSMR